MKLAELFVSITGDESKLRAAIGSAGSALKGLAGVAAAAGAAAGAVLVAEFVRASAVSGAMEDQMVGLSNAADVSGDKLLELRQRLFDMSTELKGVELDSLIAIATNAAKAGLAGEDLLKFTEGIAKLSAAMDDIPADQIVDSLIKMNSSFKLPIDQVVNLGSAIDKLADSGTSDAAQIFDASSRLAGVAKAANLAASDTLALSAVGLEGGFSSELVASSVQDFLSSMADKKGQEYFAQRIGMSLDDSGKLINDKPLEAMGRFLKTIDPKKGLGEAIEAFKGIGVESSQSAAVLLSMANNFDKVKEYSGLAAEQIQTGTQALESYGKKAETGSAQWTQMTNAIQIFETQLGDAIGPAITEIVTRLTELVKSLNEGKEGWKSFGDAARDAIDFFVTPSANGTPTQAGNYTQFAGANAAGKAMDLAEQADRLGFRPLPGVPLPMQTIADTIFGEDFWEGMRDNLSHQVNRAAESMAPESQRRVSQELDDKLQDLQAETFNAVLGAVESIPQTIADAMGTGLAGLANLQNQAQEWANSQLYADQRNPQTEPESEFIDAFEELRRIENEALDPTGIFEALDMNPQDLTDIIGMQTFLAGIASTPEKGREKPPENVAVQSLSERFRSVQEGLLKPDSTEKMAKHQEEAVGLLTTINDSLLTMKAKDAGGAAARFGK